MQLPLGHRRSSPLRRGRFFAFATLVIVAFSACRASENLDYNCTDVGISAIIISVQDSVSPSQQTFSNVTAKAVDGSYSDSVALSFVDGAKPPKGIPLVNSREGRYSVIVTADGYEVWRRSNVLVNRGTGACPQVIPVSLTARLKKL